MAKSAENCLVSLNPADGTALGFVEATATGDIPHRVQQARDVQPAWAALGPTQRARLLQEAATSLLANAPRLSALLSEETGRPRELSLREIQTTAQGITTNIRNAFPALEVRTRADTTGTTSLYQDPLGTCAIITPWVSPVAISHGLMIPALMAGNTVLLKPSHETPLIAQHMVDIYQRFLPDNVLQIVHGDENQGKALVAANVQLIAFCGSTVVGKHIVANASYGLKRLVLALGGKNTAIVLPGADLSAAAHCVLESSLGGNPRCVATERVFVDLRLAGEFEEKLIELARNYRIGSWDDPNADIGPMINASRRQNAIELIGKAMDQGAVALTGGVNHPEFFVRPTILSHVSNAMDIAHRETLAPVLCVTHFSQQQDAIATINSSAYAQGALVFGEDAAAAEVGRQLDAAIVGINKGFSGDELPRVGAKHSGYGQDPMLDGYRQFTQSRIVHH